MLLRLLVAAKVAAHTRQGSLPEPLRSRLGEVIETPTLGAWHLMAEALAGAGQADPALAGADEFIRGPLRELLYGPARPGTPESSFLRLRNRLAHGGGLARNEAGRLLGLWQEPVRRTLAAAAFLGGWEVLGQAAGGGWRCLRGAESAVEIPPPAPLPATPEADAAWLRAEGRLWLLWPLALFGKPASEMPGGRRAGPEDKAQIYTRRDSVRLLYTPLGAEGVAQSESAPPALQAFEALFRAEPGRAEAAFKVADFWGEIRKDAGQLVGRRAELGQLLGGIRAHEHGVLWLSGVAGMGKSFLMAGLAAELREEGHGSGVLVLPYRFRQGDQGRCGREPLAQFVVERLRAAGALKGIFQDAEAAGAAARLQQALGLVQDGLRVVLLLDGLDEIQRRDAKFAEEIPLGVRCPRVLWVCAGRPGCVPRVAGWSIG
jgi:hypothetical protein